MITKYRLKLFRNMRVIVFTLLLAFLCSPMAYGGNKRGYIISEASQVQKSPLKGKIIDGSGTPLIGVSLLIKGSTTGTITDIDGNFILEGVEDNDEVEISYIGYQTQVVKVGTQRVLNITLKEDVLDLDEVVVVGYGSFKKRDLTGAVTQVKGDEIANLPLRSASDALQGKSAGVTVTSTSGSPGAMGSVRIRGVGTINNNDPLYVVDGLPQGNIGWLNPSDIENIEVLKDASAQAIYGSRAANGVIMVTTKNGSKSDGSIIDFDMNIGFQYIAKTYDMLDAEGFMKYKNLAYKNAGKDYIDDFSTPEKREQILSFLGKNGGRSGTNWWKEITRQGTNAPIQNYNLSFSGSNKKTTHRASFGYMSHDGILKTSNYKRLSGRLNLDSEVKPWLKVTTNVAVVYEERQNAIENDVFSGSVFSALTADPITPVYRNNLIDIPDFLEDRIMTGYEPTNPWSQYAGVIYSNKPNAVHQLKKQAENKWNGLVTKASVAGEFNILPNLKYKSSIAVDLYRAKSSSFTPKYHLDGDEFSVDAKVGKYMDESDYWVFDNYLTYDNRWDEHAIDAILGTSAEKTRSEFLNASKDGMVTNDSSLHIIDAGTKNPFASGNHWVTSMNSYFARVFYSYKDRYMATLNYRRDGTSKFASGNRWGNFPSLSLAWNFSEESFLKNASWLDLGKLRFSWGEIGNQNVSLGAYLDQYGNKIHYMFGDTPYLGGGVNSKGNPKLKWETTRQLDLGLDLTFLSGSLRTSFDYYKRDTKNMLIQVPNASIIGLPNNPLVNVGSVENQGFEFTVDYSGRIGRDFNYNISANASTYSNKVKSLGGAGKILGRGIHLGNQVYSVIEEGEPIGFFYGYKTDGVFQTLEDVANYAHEGNAIMPKAQPGDLKFKDINGDGKIDEHDRVKIGSPHPKITYGLTLSGDYKGIDFSVFFQGSGGNKILNIFKYDIYSGTGWYNAPKDIFDKFWTGPGTTNKNYGINAETRMNQEMSDWYVESGSYLRCKNVTLGYTLPKSLTDKMKIRDLRFYISGQNLFTITPYSGLEPEIGNTNPQYSGIDTGFYPLYRVIMFGLSFKL